ncbi:hypothetical protein SAMN05880558_101529 [Aeromonas sp. RU39B]|nr:hypothetical protein SAMN05880558_101529 [Aeromonas sp. RU39B]
MLVSGHPCVAIQGDLMNDFSDTPLAADELTARFAPLLQQLLAAYASADKETFSQLVSPEWFAKHAGDRFDKGASAFRDAFGQCRKLEFVTSLRRGHDQLLVWKGLFCASEDEWLIHLQVSPSGQVEGFWIV